MTNTNLNETKDEYLIDLPKLIPIARKNKNAILLIILSSMLLFLALTFVLSKKWEANATLQVGQIPVGDASQLIEGTQQSVERIKLREFREKVLTAMSLPLNPDDDDRSELLLDSLKGSATKGTEFINISAQGFSTTDAEKALDSTISEIKSEYAALSQPAKTRLTKELKETRDKISSTTNELKTLTDQLSVSGTYKAGSDFAPSIVAINLLSSKEAELRTLRAQEIQMTSRLTAFDEQATKVINKIQVSNRAVFPKRSTFLALGLFAGLFLSFIFVLLKSSYRKTV